MKALCLAIGLALLLALEGCGGSDQATAAKDPAAKTVMPDVEGRQLDVALSDIKQAGFKDKVHVDGGGTFGIIKKSNWKVCEQSPAAGQAITTAPRLTVDRSCDDAATASTKPPTTTVPTTTSRTTSRPSTPATVANGLDASAMEKAYLGHLASNGVQSIKSMCDPSYTEWSCFYEGVSDGPGFLRVNLQTDGGWSAGDLDTMADQAGRAWFNFIGCDFPNLTMIVVTINGLDHNIPRYETGADALC
jgi:hypothetical protein